MRIISAFVLVLGLISPAIGDDGLGADDRAAIRDVIEQQLAAFQRDDAEAAFGFAAPGIQAKFRNPEIFMDMVRNAYRPVYRPRSVRFAELVVVGDAPLQRVNMIGPDGTSVVANYPMQRQPDGSWRIAGCFLTAPEGDDI